MRAGVFITECEPAATGIALAVKDLFDTAGVRTTYGSLVYADHVPDATREAVTRLEAAATSRSARPTCTSSRGASPPRTRTTATCPNPLAADRIAGGSSGGCAAALVDGLADAGVGTDSGGSIRIPAACCGIDRVQADARARARSTAASRSLRASTTWGRWRATSRAACAMMRGARARASSQRRWTPRRPARRRGLDRGRRAARARARRAAAALLPARRDARGAVPRRLLRRLRARGGRGRTRGLLPERRERTGRTSPPSSSSALALSDAKVDEAAAGHARYREQVAGATAGVDLVLTPTLEHVAPALGIGDLALRNRMIKLTFPWNATGSPALALPCGAAEDGLPASVQLVGRPGDDALVLAAGALLERALTGSRTSRTSRDARSAGARSAAAARARPPGRRPRRATRSRGRRPGRSTARGGGAAGSRSRSRRRTRRRTRRRSWW